MPVYREQQVKLPCTHKPEGLSDLFLAGKTKASLEAGCLRCTFLWIIDNTLHHASPVHWQR